MERLHKIIKEVLSTPPKKDNCNCGCHTCENVGNEGVVLNESIAPKQILSENLRYHVDKQLPLTENTFRYGSEAFLNLWSEARYLYLREIIHVNDDDKEILLETDLGEYGIYEGKKVPLDLLMLEEEITEVNKNTHKIILTFDDEKRIKRIQTTPTFQKMLAPNQIKNLKIGDNELIVNNVALNGLERMESTGLYKLKKDVNEATEKKNPPIGKPKRGGSKKFYVYVRDKGKIKKVSFGDTSGLSAKISNPKARQAFAKRHKCGTGEPKTSARYWSCRLPRFAKLLGLKGSFSGFW